MFDELPVFAAVIATGVLLPSRVGPLTLLHCVRITTSLASDLFRGQTVRECSETTNALRKLMRKSAPPARDW